MGDDLQTQLDRLKFRRNFLEKSVKQPIYTYPCAEDVHQDYIRKELQKRPPNTQPNRLHIGVAGLFNLELATITRPDALLLLDYNRGQEKFWEILTKNLETAPDEKTFLENAWHDIAVEHHRWFGTKINDGRGLQEYFNEMYNGWLTPDNFQYLKKLATEHKIMHATIDIAGSPKSSEELGQFIKQQGFHVDTCYWSNVAQFFEPEDREGHNRSTDKPVFPGNGLYYSNRYYDRSKCIGPESWNGEEYRTNLFGKTVPVSADKLPAYERLLRNISAIAGEEGMHMLTSNRPDMMPKEIGAFIELKDGKVSLSFQEIVSALMDGRPILFEGAPRRTPEQWTKREEARARYEQALNEGKGVY